MSFPDQGARPPGCGREATHEPVYDASCVRADPAQGCGHDAGRAEQRDEPQTRCQTMQPVVQVDPERALFAQRDGGRGWPTDISDRGHLVGDLDCGVPGADEHDALPLKPAGAPVRGDVQQPTLILLATEDVWEVRVG